MKSTPSFGVLAATIVASTVVSPYLASTAPSACRAILPVSRVSLRPPQSSSTRCISNIVSFSHGFGEPRKPCARRREAAARTSRCGKQQRLAILPWHFEPCLVARAIIVCSCLIAGRAHSHWLNERTRNAHPLHETHRASTPCTE